MNIINKILRRIRLEQKLYRLKVMVSKKNFHPENSILIFSDPRGGSTWLAEMIRSIPGSFIYWEPLSVKWVSQVKKLGFGWRQYIPENEKWDDAKGLFDKILSCGIINEWTTTRMDPSSFREANQPIIKICRGNHLILWLMKQYKFKYNPLILLRHPIAVVASQLKQGGWNYDFKEFTLPDMPFNKIYMDEKVFLDSLNTKAEGLLATWCITNRDLLKSNKTKGMLYFYEELYFNPLKSLKGIFDGWNLPLPDIKEEELKRWSATTIDKDEDREKQLGKWRKQFNESELQRFQEILDHFSIEEYSVNNNLPKRMITN